MEVDWHPADILAALKKHGHSLAKLSRQHGHHHTAAGKALFRPWPAMERIIGGALNISPAQIWPSRYDADGYPLKHAHQTKASASPGRPPDHRSDETHTKAAKSSILIYEDDKVFALAVASILQDAGYGVQLVDDLRPALTALESEVSIDLVLADIVVPGRMSGIAFARMARLRHPSAKVIFVTGYDIGESQAGWPILRKPISDERLLFEVNRELA